MKSLSRDVRNFKAKGRNDLAAPISHVFDIPPEVSMMADGSSIVFYDSHTDEDSTLDKEHDRLIMLATASTLDELELAEDWASDGTFQKAPKHFMQIYSIHFRDGQSFRPAVIAFLTRKTSKIYKVMVEKLFEQIPNSKPQRIFVDFEQAAISAFKHQFGGK